MNNQHFKFYHVKAWTNTRLTSLLLIAIAILLGLTARANRNEPFSNPLLKFAVTYTGDTLWGLMFYFVGRFLLPRIRIYVLAICTLVLTIGIEFSQLWKPEWLEAIRAQPFFGFLIGRSFVLSDIVCLLAGVGLSVLLDFYFGLRIHANLPINSKMHPQEK